MSIHFGTLAEPAAADLSLSISSILRKEGILSAEDVEKSYECQAMMVAVRDAITNGHVSVENARSVIGDAHGGIDFLSLTNHDTSSRVFLNNAKTKLMRLALNMNDVQRARDYITHANDAGLDINDGQVIQIPQIEQIHTELFDNDIENFADIKAGISLAKCALELAATGRRIQHGELDPHASSRKGFQIHGSSSQDLKLAVAAVETLHRLEMQWANGEHIDVNHDAIAQNVVDILGFAEDAFVKADQAVLVYKTRLAKELLVQDDTPPSTNPVYEI